MEKQTQEQEKMNTPEAKPEANKQTTSGTGNKAWWEDVANSIAGNSESLKKVLSFVLSPVTLIVGGTIFAFWYFKVKKTNAENEKLNAENQKLLLENAWYEKKHKKLKKKHNKLIELSGIETEHIEQSGFQPHLVLPNKKTYQTSYLD